MLILISILLVVFLLIAFIGDLVQFSLRIMVSIFKYSDLSTHLVSVSMLINRLGAAVSLLLIGLAIDIGFSYNELILLYGFFTLSLSFCYYLAFLFPLVWIPIMQYILKTYYKKNVIHDTHNSTFPTKLSLRKDMSLVFLISIFGFLIPSVAASLYPDFRGSLLQSGFILNTVATVYTAMIIEKEIAIVLNDGLEFDKWLVLGELMKSRAVGALLSSAILFIIYVFT